AALLGAVTVMALQGDDGRIRQDRDMELGLAAGATAVRGAAQEDRVRAEGGLVRGRRLDVDGDGLDVRHGSDLLWAAGRGLRRAGPSMRQLIQRTAFAFRLLVVRRYLLVTAPSNTYRPSLPAGLRLTLHWAG